MKFITLIIILIIIAGSISAEVPNQMNYQGRLLDTTGEPVNDGLYSLIFRLYTMPSGGTAIWTETQNVTTDDGFFTAVLGKDNPLDPDDFQDSVLYLAMQIGTDTELSPRIRLTSTAYAMTAGSVSGDPYLNKSGDTLTGNLSFYNNGNSGSLVLSDGYGNLILQDNGENKTYIYGQEYGSVFLYDSDGDVTATLDAHGMSGGELKLTDENGIVTFDLKGGSDGDLSAQLPDDAINADEILNEPGVARNTIYSANLDQDEMTDIVTVDIDIPAAGYIYATARCYLKFSEASLDPSAYFQIDETSGGTYDSPYYVMVSIDHVEYTSTYRLPVFVDRMYYKNSPGSYTFIFEGLNSNDTLATAAAYNCAITAVYYPTAYEAVKSYVDDPGDNPEAVPIMVTDEEGNSEQKYEVDLRYYELKAKEARIRALEAELELKEARERSRSDN